MSQGNIFSSELLTYIELPGENGSSLSSKNLGSTLLSGTESSSSRSREDMDAVIGLECTRGARCCHRLQGAEADDPAKRCKAP